MDENLFVTIIRGCSNMGNVDNNIDMQIIVQNCMDASNNVLLRLKMLLELLEKFCLTGSITLELHYDGCISIRIIYELVKKQFSIRFTLNEHTVQQNT